MQNVYGWIASFVCGALCAQSALADINGGGATLPSPLYQTAGVLTAGFAPYIGVGSGNGKAAFLNNDYTKFVSGVTNKNVHWAASDSRLTALELATYASTKQPTWGKLIQVPSMGTSVAIPFNKSGTAAVDLSVNELCGVFSGRIVDWRDISGSGRAGVINVIYPGESSGTTELFTRFLNAKCNEGGLFKVTTTFATSFTGGLAAGAVAATGSQGVMAALAARDGTITYMSPAFAANTLEGLDDATKVARVGKNIAYNIQGVSPTPSNVSAALYAIPIPAPANRPNPDAWAPVFGPNNTDGVQPYPTSGYPILGFTNLIFSQCYADPVQTSQVRDFLTRHYGVRVTANNDTVIAANAFVPLPPNWKAIIRASFLTASNALSIGNTNVCNGIGRPL
ncbi:Phosphate-binding protein [Pseudomonas marginalis]|jgi:ABC-type phosphate transport system substrate-binding protein|uniref:substrate-binding domain-containing protein n=1 Tax=Pseudomonas TaxID=286 RepID=UPI0004B4086F|nr:MULTISPECIES: substrate-binding domain-containing protein [unclassified Pseudomonas]SMF71676.1 phosphate ABC transporter substrate-binding protein, PhoT family (TC 3.A.1.7.1) [Pseudomonas sp. LAMO17WK12:I1]